MDIPSRFNHFIAQIRPSREQLEVADKQVAFLRKELTERIATNKQFHLEKIFRSGSAAKHTDLARTGKDIFDIDLGVYYRAEGWTEKQLSTLLAYTRTQLREIYPAEKLVKDFRQGKNAVNITFHTSRLKVDVVPIIRDGSLKRNYGWIPRLDKPRLTSIPAHIHFIHKRTARSKLISGPVKFNHLVRLMKYWNRQLPDNLKQCSYFCELITAAALENCDVTNAWQSSLCTIFAFLSQRAFEQPIIFNDYYDAKSVRCDDLVVVLDAVNAGNNVAREWDESIKRGYLKCVQQTYQSIRSALDYEQMGLEEMALDVWCEVFGNDFRRLSQ